MFVADSRRRLWHKALRVFLSGWPVQAGHAGALSGSLLECLQAWTTGVRTKGAHAVAGDRGTCTRNDHSVLRGTRV